MSVPLLVTLAERGAEDIASWQFRHPISRPRARALHSYGASLNPCAPLGKVERKEITMGALTINREGVPPAALNEMVISHAHPSTRDHHGRLADGRLMSSFTERVWWRW